MIGENLNKIRKLKGFTAQYMSDILNISLRSYHRYESNERQPSIEALIKIADCFDVSLDYLVGRNKKTEHCLD